MKETITIKVTRTRHEEPVTGEYEYSVTINGEETDDVFDTKENMIAKVITALKYETAWEE